MTTEWSALSLVLSPLDFFVKSFKDKKYLKNCINALHRSVNLLLVKCSTMLYEIFAVGISETSHTRIFVNLNFLISFLGNW